MDEKREREIMELADEWARFYKHLVRQGVSDIAARDGAGRFLQYLVLSRNGIVPPVEPPDKKPWE